MLTDEEIRYWSTSINVYQRGEVLYQMGAVPKVQVVQEGNTYTVRGYVEGSEGDAYYNVLEMNTASPDAVYFECECPAAHKYEGACKHTVAVMFKLQEMARSGTLNPHHVDRISGQALLDDYETSIIRSLDKPKEGTIRIEPKLMELGDGTFGVTLSVGEDKLYVVKHIAEFMENIIKEEQASYGKYLSFVHCLEVFEEQTQPLIRLLLQQYTDRAGVLGQVYGGKFYSMDKKILQLTQSGFDRFFDLYRGQVVSVQDDRGTMELELLEDNPNFVFRIEEQGDTFKVSTTTKHYQMIQHPLYTYVWTETGIYRVKPSFASRVVPVLRYMQEVYPPQLTFDAVGFKRFSATILGALKKWGQVQMPAVVEKDYSPPQLTIKVYLDYEQHHQVTARVMFDYGSYAFNPFEQQGEGLARCIEEEYVFETLLETFGFRANKGVLYLEDEDAIYTFLTGGIDKLIAVSEVHITDQLKDLKVTAPPIGRIGIKMKSNLLEIKIEELGLSPQDIEAIIQAYRQRKKYYRLKSGAFVDLAQDDIEVLDEMVMHLGLEESDFERGSIEIACYRTLYLDTLLQQASAITVKKDKATRQMLRHMTHYEQEEERIPESLDETLRSYQKVGYLWLYMLADYGMGGILADDMGLGKTLQVISLLVRAKEEDVQKPSLVVAPTSLILNWEKELAKFAPQLKVSVLSGSSIERQQLLKEDEACDVMITSYDTLKRDVAYYKNKTFRYCIADEAHYVKNPQTQNAKVLKSIASEVNFALTGTPIENNLSELWSLFDFCMPGFLGSYHQFKASYETPIMRMQDTKAMVKLQRIIAPFILRRLKKDVLKELPPKTETLLYNEMEEEQETVYKAHLALVQKELNQALEAQGLGKSHMKILAMLTRLRQLCCHPQLYLEDYDGESSKLTQCMELVWECVEGGHKVLIFSQFTSMLQKLGEALQAEQTDYYMLTGQTKAEKRMEMVDAFNVNDVPVFLISLKAGGTGLNLTGADVVIHYDPWWNVSSEHQATDRVYRIGQDKPVQVFKLITKNSIEEKIKELQDKKIALADKLLTTEAVMMNQLSEHEIRALFS